MTPSMIPLSLTPDSSQLHGYGYDAAGKVLAVEYRSNHDSVTYHYKEVPAEAAQGLDAAESKGAFIFKQIKPKFDFDRLEKEPAPAAEPQEE